MKSKILLRKADAYRPKLIEGFVREAFSIFNGKNPLFVMGDRILLKPNLLRGFGPDRCVTTHPVVIGAVCRVLKDLGINRIDISDSPALGSLPAVAEKAGYGDLRRRYGVRLVPLTDPVPLNTEENIAHLKIAGSINEYDRIINLPKFKSHCQMTLTLSIKNLFGLIIGKRKPVLHCLVKNNKLTFGKMLIDIARHVAPCLTIMDGVIAMQGNGPVEGSPYPLGLLAAGQDMTALDRVLSDMVRVPLNQVYALEAARTKQFGQYEMEQIKLVGETNIESLQVSDFKLANYPVDITFNPFRVAKSLFNQFYEVRFKEKLSGSN